MTEQKKNCIRFFDQYRLVVPAGLNCHADGLPGQRVLFIHDAPDTFTVSFEEDMRPMDLLPDPGGSIPSVRYQYRTDDRYIHLRRSSSGMIVFAFFYIEFQNPDDKIHTLAGQIVTNPDYQWTDGIEPVLLELLDGLTVELS